MIDLEVVELIGLLRIEQIYHEVLHYLEYRLEAGVMIYCVLLVIDREISGAQQPQ